MESTLETFIGANQKLMDCYAKVPDEDYKKLSPVDQDLLCINEQTQVKTILESGQMDFKNILKERIEILDQKQAVTKDTPISEVTNIYKQGIKKRLDKIDAADQSALETQIKIQYKVAQYQREMQIILEDKPQKN